MKLQIQNKPQCLAYAFAMALDVPVQQVFDYVGHDGLAVWWPEVKAPWCYRGFHHQEMIDYAMTLGINVVMIEAGPALGNAEKCELVWPEVECIDRVRRYMLRHSGVITTPAHAIAWDHVTQCGYDPNGILRDVADVSNFAIREFFILNRGEQDGEELRRKLQRTIH